MLQKTALAQAKDPQDTEVDRYTRARNSRAECRIQETTPTIWSFAKVGSRLAIFEGRGSSVKFHDLTF
jgi:hypothetical protein